LFDRKVLLKTLNGVQKGLVLIKFSTLTASKKLSVLKVLKMIIPNNFASLLSLKKAEPELEAWVKKALVLNHNEARNQMKKEFCLLCTHC